jgi:SAM-dependent methyltransferase
MPDRDDFESELARLGPWLFNFAVNGTTTGGRFPLPNEPKWSLFQQAFPNVRTVLELGSCEGYNSFQLAERADRVVSVEGRAKNLEKAHFLQPWLDPDRKIQFVEGNLESCDLSSFGTFDVIWCTGLLYHLPEPWRLVMQMPGVSRNLFLSTHYASDLDIGEVRDGFAGRWCEEGGLADGISGMSSRSFRLTLGSLIRVLTVAGYSTVVVMKNIVDHPVEPVVMLAATVSAAP